MKPRLAILPLLLAFAACGDASDPRPQPAGESGGVSAAGGRPTVDAQVSLARCLRRQGIDIPDPRAGGGFELDPGEDDSELREAESHCERERRALADSLPKRSQRQLGADRDATLRFARCMRRQGQAVPDPRAGGGAAGTAVEVPPDAKENPAFQAAQRRCGAILRELGPDGR